MTAARTPTRAVSGLLFMTGFVCMVELTILVRCLNSGQSPAITALVMAGFHVGYLGADSAARCLGARTTCALASTATVSAGAALAILGSTWALVVLVISSMLFNTAAQAARRRLKAQATVSSAVKNTAKATGMIIGGLLGASAWLLLLLIIPAAVILHLGFASGPVMNCKITEQAAQRSKMLLWSEFLHHAHYFAYCYTFWYLAPSLIGPLTGVWFLMGWLAYFVAEFAWREQRTDFSPRFMASGHALVAAILVAMPFLPTATALIAWFITGIGGGTAYMLGNAGPQGKRERYEDAGHVVGALLAAAAATTHETAAAGATATTFLAASLAAAAAATSWCVREAAIPPVSTTIGT